MITIPDSWQFARIDECCLVIQGQSPPGSTYNESGDGLPFFQGKADFGSVYPTVRKWCTAPTKVADPGDVLISVRAPVGPTNLCEERCCIGRGLAALRPLGSINSKYVLYGLRATEALLAAEGSGSTFEAITGEQLRDHQIPLAPLKEQERIVGEIEKQLTRLDNATAALKRVRSNLKQYRASVLQAACEGRLVPTEAELASREGRSYEPASELLKRILAERRAKWEADQLAKMLAAGKPPKNDDWKKKYKEPSSADISYLPPLPAGWVWATAEQCTFFITDGEHITPERSDSSVLLLSARNVLNGRLSFHEVDFISERVYEQLSKRLAVQRGDVLLSCSGSVGRSCVVPAQIRFALVRSVAVLRPCIIDSHFLSLMLRSPFLQEQIRNKSTQTAQANIFQGKIKSLILPLPPIEEQVRIVSESERLLTNLEASLSECSVALNRSMCLRQAILRHAFTGNLVPQDRTDEPASVLLAHIRAERGARGKRTIGRRPPQKAIEAAVALEAG